MNKDLQALLDELSSVFEDHPNLYSKIESLLDKEESTDYSKEIKELSSSIEDSINKIKKQDSIQESWIYEHFCSFDQSLKEVLEYLQDTSEEDAEKEIEKNASPKNYDRKNGKVWVSSLKRWLVPNKPYPSTRPGKKKMVLASKSVGGETKYKLIHFGAKGYGHNYSAAARKSFRARHNCSNADDKFSAQYWACKVLWGGPGKDTKSSPKSKRGKY